MLPAASSSTAAWAMQTFGRVNLPDERLKQRLVVLAAALADKVGCTIPQACAEPAATKAAYRFLENERVSAGPFVTAAAQATALACAGTPTILAVQDTCTISFPKGRQTQGLGPVGEEHGVQGLFLHSVLAVRENGLPVGPLGAQIWARDPEEHGQAEERHNRPFEEKESYKWVEGIRQARAHLAAQLVPAQRPRLIHIMDREGDVHEVFAELEGTTDGAVIRCAQNRCVAGPLQYAHQSVRAAPRLGCLELEVPRQPGQPARKAQVEVRASQVVLRPNRGRHPERKPLALNLLEVWEPAPPQGAEALHWLLWTTEPAATLSEAIKVIGFYGLRWRIEDMHLVLKEGCHIEELQLETAARMAEALAIYLAIAVRVLALRDGARKMPLAPCTVLLKEEEWQALWLQRHKKPAPPDQAPPTLLDAVKWIGRMGGHQGRKGDGLPGVKVLWRGWRDLMLVAEMYVMLQHKL